jgi:DNA-binding CsgD family transcriptional regulator
MGAPNDANASVDRRRSTLEQLLRIDAVEVRPALDQATLIVAEALAADKVDAFVYEPETASLVALGTSNTPMGRLQIRLGLNRLPVANGGRAAEVFRSGESRVDGHVDRDPKELEGIRIALGVRSAMLCPLIVAGETRGVLSAVSAEPEHFGEDDVPFFEAVTHWLALMLHRAELIEQVVGRAEQRGRREAVAQMLALLTPRQREVAGLIALGLTNEQIAERLVLTPGTVANHVEHILRRLSVRSRTEVAALAAEIGLHRRPPPRRASLVTHVCPSTDQRDA